MKMKTLQTCWTNFAAGLLTTLLLCGTAAADGELTETDLYISGSQGYRSYRIPAMITTDSGVVLAFAEGRRDGRGDAGAIATLLRRSLDGGETWGEMQVVARDGENTFGNPCPVIDRRTGRIHLLLTHNLGSDHERQILAGTSEQVRTVWHLFSDNDGETWSEPRDISKMARKPHWRWYATGPGVGIQTRDGTLVIPANHSDHTRHEAENRDDRSYYRSHVLLSDDGGETWRIGGVADENTNESQVAELTDGSLMLNMRSYHGQARRAIATSRDGGKTWSDVRFDPALVEPVCQASLLRYSGIGDGAVSRLLFSNPANPERRVNMTVRLSLDEGKTWPVSRTVHDGFSAYSCLTVLPNGDIGLFYEKGQRVEKLTLARFPLSWLSGSDGIAETQ